MEVGSELECKLQAPSTVMLAKRQLVKRSECAQSATRLQTISRLVSAIFKRKRQGRSLSASTAAANCRRALYRPRAPAHQFPVCTSSVNHKKKGAAHSPPSPPPLFGGLLARKWRLEPRQRRGRRKAIRRRPLCCLREGVGRFHFRSPGFPNAHSLALIRAQLLQRRPLCSRAARSAPKVARALAKAPQRDSGKALESQRAGATKPALPALPAALNRTESNQVGPI